MKKKLPASAGRVPRLVRQDGWASTGAIVAERIGLIPQCQIPPTFWPYLPKPKEWHHARRNGKLIQESWWTKQDVETARKANKAAKRRAKWAAKKSLPNSIRSAEGYQGLIWLGGISWARFNGGEI